VQAKVLLFFQFNCSFWRTWKWVQEGGSFAVALLHAAATAHTVFSLE